MQRSSLGPFGRLRQTSVWEDRAAQSGRKLTINFLVLRAEGESQPAKEAVILFAGGPGQGSVDMAGLANGPFRPIRKSRDVLMVDQRGTGRSNPLLCDEPVVQHPEVAFGHVFDPPVFRQCHADFQTRANLKLYTTEQAISDVDDVRASLGYERVLVYGVSYGTRIAQAYMRAYPDRVVAAVLDGVVPFDFRAPISYAKSAQQALDRVLADCHLAPACRNDNPDAGLQFAALLHRFDAGPVPVMVRGADSTETKVSLSRGDFGYAVRGILYRSGGGRALPAMIRRAATTGDLSEFAQRYWEREADFGGFANGLHFAIFCAEDVQFIKENEVARATADTFLGRYLVDEYRTICHDWTIAPVTDQARRPLTSPIPTLLLSGWFDPVTPPPNAERVARGLGNAVHLIVRNEAHGSGFGCARPAVLHVLTGATLAGLPPVCQAVTNLWE